MRLSELRVRGETVEIKPGDRVTIETGLQTAEGIVTRVEPIAAALPREFRGTFTPVERQQVIRIEFAEAEIPLPLFTKVKLRSGILLPRWIRWIW